MASAANSTGASSIVGKTESSVAAASSSAASAVKVIDGSAGDGCAGGGVGDKPIERFGDQLCRRPHSGQAFAKRGHGRQNIPQERRRARRIVESFFVDRAPEGLELVERLLRPRRR